MPSAGDLMDLAEHLVESCPAAALLVEAGGRLRSANPAAASLLGVGAGSGEPSLRESLGVGWREVEVIVRDGKADLVAELPASPLFPGRRSVRVRFEPVPGSEGRLFGVVAFLQSSSAILSTTRPAHRGGIGFDALFGHDPALVATKLAAERFARTVLPILVLAETGTGKDLLARAIHSASPRREQPFVAINCGALSPHLLESELFGYAPGAFTGASREGHEGRIGAARGGTLFLDEVAEMPGPLQALLLRVLEDGTYYRVGENRPRQADVRLICATCRELPRLVEEGGFRDDLFYRINGACLSLPTLRQRCDVGDLVHHLLDKLADEQGLRPVPEISTEALEWLCTRPWPGNVRQLKTALQHALILCDGGPIGLVHLPRDLVAGPQLADPHPARSEAPPAGTPRSPAPLRRSPTLAELERQRLLDAVEAARGNLSLAASQLGIARSTLYRRLRRHGLVKRREDAPP